MRAYHCILAGLLFTFAASCASVPSTQTTDKTKLAEAHYKLGLAYLAQDAIQPAFVEFRKAIGLNPKDKTAWNLLGYIHTLLEEYAQAEDSFQRSLSVDPDYSDAHNNLGVLYNHQARWDEAIVQFQSALKNPLYETPQKAFNNMGFALMKKGDLQGAKNAFEQALMRGPLPQAHYNLAIVLFQLGDDENAVSELNAALRNSPGYVEAHWRIAQYYLDKNQGETAIPHLEAVARQLPNDERGRSAQRYLNLLKNTPAPESK